MLSVIIATYNGEKFIIEQLESIVNQTKKVDKIYIYDDCSQDKTLFFVEEWVKRNNISNIYVHVNKKNKGYTKNFLDALLEIEDDYIFLCDQDDVWREDKVEKTFKSIIENRDKEIPLLFTSGYSICDEKLKVIKECHLDTSEISLDYFIKDCSFPGMTFCINKQLKNIIKEKLNYEKIPFHDYFISVLALSNGKMICIPEALVFYRQHGKNQLGAGGNGKKTRKHWLKVLNQKRSEFIILDYCNIQNIFIKKRFQFLNRRIKFFRNRNFIHILFNVFNYLKLYNFKSFLGDIYYSLKKDENEDFTIN